MKYYLLIIALFISILSFGQNSEIETKPEKERLSKIIVSPFFSYDFNLSPKSVIEGSETNKLVYNNFNYRVGVAFEYKFNSNFSISSGLNYSDKSFSYTIDCPTCDPIVQLYAVFDVYIGFVEIPLIGIYTYKFNDFEFFGEIGFINHLNVGINIFLDSNGINMANIDEYNLSGKIGLGASYPVLNRHRLFISTDYSSGLTNVFENVDYKLKTLGIRMGIQFLL